MLELVRGSVQLHDIGECVDVCRTFVISAFAVRDWVLSKHKDRTKLRRLQRQFITELMSSQESWKETRGNTIPKKQELDWYMKVVAFVLCSYLCA